MVDKLQSREQMLAGLATPANGEQVERADEADRVELAAFLDTYADEADGDLVNRNPCDPLLTWGILRRVAATLSTSTEDARERVKVLEEAARVAERNRIISEARCNLRLTQGCLECNADDERRWMDTIAWLESLA